MIGPEDIVGVAARLIGQFGVHEKGECLCYSPKLSVEYAPRSRARGRRKPTDPPID